jgi:hypothetical protein
MIREQAGSGVPVSIESILIETVEPAGAHAMAPEPRDSELVPA